MKVAASPQVIYEAMPESSIQVTSHLRLLIPSHSSLATHPCLQTSEFRVWWRLRRKYIGDARLPFSSLFPSKKPQSESSDSLCGFFDADKI